MPPFRKAETSADFPTAAEMAVMSGREFMENIRDGVHPAAPIAEALGFWLEEVEDGRITFRGRPSLRGYNPAGTMHGGWFGTLLDSCMACAVQTRLPKGRTYRTLEYKVNILRPIFETTHVGRRTGVATGRIVGAEDGKVYATGSTTCIVMEV